MEVRVLGRLDVRVDGAALALPGTAAPAVLAMLALREGARVRTDELIDGLWDRNVPAEPRAALHVTIARLRRALGPHRDIVQSRPGGYALARDGVELDLAVAERARREGADLLRRGDHASAVVCLSAGLAEWRGAPLADLADLPFVTDVVTRLHLLRLDLVEARNDALLLAGRPAEVLPDAEELLAADPWRERLVGQLMLALYRCGRQGDALSAYARLSSALKRDLGVAPEPGLQSLHARILRHDRGLYPDRPHEVEQPDLPAWFRAALDTDDEADDRVRFRLLLALGEAQHHAGEPGWPATLLEAGALARGLDDPVALARAACAGAHGWGIEGGTDDAARLDLVEAALAVPTLDLGWRARLLATKAVERGFTAGLDERLALNDEALRLARAAGEPSTLLAVLNQRFTAIWAPQTRDDRRHHAHQAMRLADAIGRPTAQAFAAGWAMAVAVEDGDIAAVDRHLARFRSLAEDTQASVLVWGALVHGSWRAVIAGDLEQAEERCDAALALGTRSGRPEAQVVATIQRAGIRWAQDRLGEEASVVGALTEALPHLRALDAWLALAHHGVGEVDLSRRALDAACRSGFEHLHLDQAYLAALVLWADLACRLADEPAARVLIGRLAPFHDHVAFTGTGVYGPVSHALGALAAVTGDDDAARRHLGAALATADGMGSPLFAGRARAVAATHGLGLGLMPGESAPRP